MCLFLLDTTTEMIHRYDVTLVYYRAAQSRSRFTSGEGAGDIQLLHVRLFSQITAWEAAVACLTAFFSFAAKVRFTFNIAIE